MPRRRLITPLPLVALLAACRGAALSPPQPPPPAPPPAAAPLQLEVTPAAATIPSGSAAPIAAVGHYADGSTADLSDVVTWSSSDPTRATITDDGDGWHVHAAGAGSVTISAALGDLSGAASFTLVATLDAIEVTPGELRLSPCSARQYSAIGHFSDGTVADLTAVAQWSSSNDAVAVASNATAARGLVQTLGAGTATISARYGDVFGGAPVLADPTMPKSVAISPGDNMDLVAGDSAAFTLDATYCDGSTADLTADGVWQSSDPEVATVSRTEGGARIVDAATTGRATIAASYGAVADQIVVTVDPPVLQSIYISSSTTSLTVGAQTQFDAIAVYSDGSEEDVTAEVTWSSYEPDVATVSASGVVQAVAQGSATIVADLGDMLYASGFVDVSP